jgi:phospholipase C
MMRMYGVGRLAGLMIVSSAVLVSSVQAQADMDVPQPTTPIKHLVVLMQQNHSFDNYFGTYPGVDGIPPDICMPIDPADPRAEPCVKPFHIGNLPIADLNHSAATSRFQYNQGRMDGFIAALRRRNQDGTITMGYYNGQDVGYYWNLADEYVLFDRFFSSAHGGSLPNHMYWVTATPGTATNRIPLAGYADLPTIFDRLEARGVSWKFYVQNYDPSITYRSLTSAGSQPSQLLRVPLLNYARFVDNPALFARIVDLNDYFTDLQNGTLPAVAYIISSGASEHPPGSILAGQRFVKALIQALMQSTAWEHAAFVLIYDDWGGWYDHVPPPQIDAHGYGFRVPALLISPYAKRGFVDSTELDFTSILKFIEENYRLQPLAERDARAQSIVNGFDFSQVPRSPHFTAATRGDPQAKAEPQRMAIFLAYGAALIIGGLIMAAPLGRFNDPSKPE